MLHKINYITILSAIYINILYLLVLTLPEDVYSVHEKTIAHKTLIYSSLTSLNASYFTLSAKLIADVCNYAHNTIYGLTSSKLI